MSSKSALGRRTEDLTGRKIGRWFVISFENYAPNGTGAMWNCVCECGNKKIVRGSFLRSGESKSCGCLHLETIATQGNLSRSGEYASWHSMLQRCYNENCQDYEIYGGRGIQVCDRWRNSFLDFLADMGRKPDGKKTIDRINSNGNYEPDNCRWADDYTQANNTRKNIKCTYKGKTQTLSEWCRELSMDYNRVKRRIARGWTIDRAFEDKRRPNVIIEYKGRSQTLTEWAKELNVDKDALNSRLLKGMEIELAFETPFRSRRRKHHT